MAILNQNTGERFVETIYAQGGASAVTLFSIPQNATIQDIKVVVDTAGVGAANFSIGDDDDDDGFIAAKDATSAANTVVGDDPTERGAYLYDSTKKGSFTKTYTAAGKTLQLKMSTTQTTYIKAKVTVIGWRH
jgi:hypothetical protein